MAQRDKEETEFKVPETLTLCINNCGFTGNPATKNMCQSCFKSSTTTTGILTFSTTTQDKKKPRSTSSSSLRLPERSTEVIQNNNIKKEEDQIVVIKQGGGGGGGGVNRCSGCRRKVGLTGIRCRCGDLFCSEHRYSDRHDCSFDYKAAGRESIARENPLVKAAKILRI